MVSIKTKYAVAVLVKMASDESQSYTIKQLSEQCCVPKKYLEQILSSLRKDRLVVSTRGVNGGYQIARSASAISVLDIALSLEQTLSFTLNYNGGSAITEFWESIDSTLKDGLMKPIDSLVKEKKVLSYTI